MTKILFTVGHSNRPLEAFLEVLKTHGIKLLVDVRKMPRSRANPQFNIETLPDELARAGIAYRYAEGLSGLRRRDPDSINTAWRNKSFQAFADYMQTEAFARSLEELLNEAEKEPTAIMCAEVLPWRCHRSLIGDAAVVRGFKVMDLYSEKVSKPHSLRSFARVKNDKVFYP